MSRRTLYRVFLFRQLTALGATVRHRLEKYTDVDEALIDGSVYSVAVGESDPLFVEVVTHEHDRSIERFLMSDRRLRSAVVEVWSPILATGRQAGRVRFDRVQHPARLGAKRAHDARAIRTLATRGDPRTNYPGPESPLTSAPPADFSTDS